jgi:hypothetical protein
MTTPTYRVYVEWPGGPTDPDSFTDGFDWDYELTGDPLAYGWVCDESSWTLTRDDSVPAGHLRGRNTTLGKLTPESAYLRDRRIARSKLNLNPGVRAMLALHEMSN